MLVLLKNMKLFIIVVLAISAAASAEIEGRAGGGISQQIIDALEKMRDQMPCGFEKYNIPPLAPLKIEKKELALKTSALSVDGEVEKLRIDGLNTFKILEMKINILLSKLNFKINFPEISVNSKYEMFTNAKAYGFTVDVKGKGDFRMSLKDLEISGVVKYSIVKGIKMKSCKIITTIGDVDSNIEGILGHGLGNRKMNELLEELIMLGINDNQELMTNTIEEMVVPKVNDALEGYTLADIIGIIAGGEGSEPVICVPPEDN